MVEREIGKLRAVLGDGVFEGFEGAVEARLIGSDDHVPRIVEEEGKAVGAGMEMSEEVGEDAERVIRAKNPLGGRERLQPQWHGRRDAALAVHVVVGIRPDEVSRLHRALEPWSGANIEPLGG